MRGICDLPQRADLGTCPVQDECLLRLHLPRALGCVAARAPFGPLALALTDSTRHAAAATGAMRHWRRATELAPDVDTHISMGDDSPRAPCRLCAPVRIISAAFSTAPLTCCCDACACFGACAAAQPSASRAFSYLLPSWAVLAGLTSSTHLNDTQGALQHFSRAQQLDANHPFPYVAAATIYMRAGDHQASSHLHHDLHAANLSSSSSEAHTPPH